MKLNSKALGILVLALAGCGGAPEAKGPDTASIAKDVATVAAPLKLVPIDNPIAEGKVVAAAHFRGDAFRSGVLGKLAQNFAASIPDPKAAAKVKEAVASIEKTCGAPLVELVRDATVAAYEEEALGSVRFTIPDDKVVPCLHAILPEKTALAKVDGRPALLVDDGAMVVVVHEGSTYVGSERLTKRVLTTRTVLPAAMQTELQVRNEGEFVTLAGDLGSVTKGDAVAVASLVKVFHGAIWANGRELGMAGTGITASFIGTRANEISAEMEKGKAEFNKKLQQLTPEQEKKWIAENPDLAIDMPTLKRLAGKLLNATSLSGKDRGDGKSDVRGSFRFEASEQDQATLIGVMSSLAVHAVHRYIARSKTAEATYNIGRIARAVRSQAESGKCGKKVCPVFFPPSAPSVPKVTPKGDKYSSTKGDWNQPAWKSLQFEISLPQYFRYTWVTSKDRKKIEILAFGDFNGDGKESTFKMVGVVKKDGDGEKVEFADDIEETNVGE